MRASVSALRTVHPLFTNYETSEKKKKMFLPGDGLLPAQVPKYPMTRQSFVLIPMLLLSLTMNSWWLLAKAVNPSLSILCSSYSILNTVSSSSLTFGDGVLERRQYEDQGLGETTPLTIICQPMQVRLIVRVVPHPGIQSGCSEDHP